MWFRTRSNDILLSYDGKVFKRYPAHGQGHSYVGTCPNTGIAEVQLYRYGANWQVGETVFLAESHGVLCVTGDKADYHPLTDADQNDRDGPNNPVISPEPDGKGVLGARRGQRAADTASLRDGHWKEVPVPGTFSGQVVVAGTVVMGPWTDGVWVFQQHVSAFFVRYEGLSDKALDEMVAELGHKEYAVREKATARLVAFAAQIRDRLEKTLKATDDPEIRHRLAKVLSATAAKEGVSQLGPLELQRPALSLCEGGWMYVQAEKITEDGKDRGPGVVLAKTGGEYRLFLGNEVYESFDYGPNPLVAKEHALIWTGFYKPRAKLFDVEKGAFVLALPRPAVLVAARRHVRWHSLSVEHRETEQRTHRGFPSE